MRVPGDAAAKFAPFPYRPMKVIPPCRLECIRPRFPPLSRCSTTSPPSSTRRRPIAAERKIEPEVLLNWRLAPDMFPLTRQIQIAADFAKGATARLAGNEVPKYADDEKSFAELKARIAKTVKFVESIAPKDFDGSEKPRHHAYRRRPGIALQGRALSRAFRPAQFLFPRHHRLRHPQALRRRDRQARFSRRDLTAADCQVAMPELSRPRNRKVMSRPETKPPICAI